MSGYDTDILEWSEHQSALLRRLAAGESINDQIDWPNIIDEVETVGRSERAVLRSHIAVVLEHLMKLQASPSVDPRNGWTVTLLRARRVIERSLEDSPSLCPAVAAISRTKYRPHERSLRLLWRRIVKNPVSRSTP